MDHIEKGRLAFVKNGETWIPARVEGYRKLFTYCYLFRSALNPTHSFDCTEDDILQCSVNMYNMVCKNMNVPRLTDFTDVEPDDELHAGDFVLIGAEWDRPARIVSFEIWPGGRVYHLIGETGDERLYKRDELVHVSEKEYLKHCPGSSTYVSLDSIINQKRLNSPPPSDGILANIPRVAAKDAGRIKMAKDSIPENYLVAFLFHQTNELLPGVVSRRTPAGSYIVAIKHLCCTVATDESDLLVISPKTYNLIVDRLNDKKIAEPFLTHVIEDAYIQHDTLHPGDCVILMENSGAATVHEVCCENGEYLYLLENINNEYLRRRYRRHELIKISVHEYCKHLKHSTCYLDYLERIYMTAEANEIVVSEEPEFVVVGPIGNRIPGIRLSTFTKDGQRCSRILMYNGFQTNHLLSYITPITREEYDRLVADTHSSCGIKMYSGALPSWIRKMNGFQKLADRLAEIIKVQKEIEDKRKMKKLSPKYKVGDMVYWAYCSYNDNKLPAYVRKVVWDDLCGTCRYVMVMANGAVTGEIAEHAVKPCTDEEEFDNVVEQTSGVLDQEDSWMSWQALVEHVKNMDNDTVVCDNCGKEVCIEDSHHCRDCAQDFCDDCWGDHDCCEDEDEETVECECCGEEIPESESVVCPDCEKTLCDKCLGSSHGCTDEDDEDDEEDKPDPKPELTAEEAVRRWMGKE